MTPNAVPVTVLMADDDADDRLMMQQAFHDCRLSNPLQFAQDGVELMDYLRRRGRFAEAGCFPMPSLILLDLNMPRKDGREALRDIKSDPLLRQIPVVVLSTSRAEEDIARCYAEGANSFISKPVTFEGLIEAVCALDKYWLQIVDLPHVKAERRI